MYFHAEEVPIEDLRPGDLWSTMKPAMWHKDCRQFDNSLRVNIMTLEPLPEAYAPTVYRITYEVLS